MRIIIGLVLLLCSFSVNAASITDIKDTNRVCQKAAAIFGTGDAKVSFETLKPYWPLPKEEIDNLAYQTESQLKMVSSRFGKILGSDFVSTRRAGNSFVRHTYIIKFEKHAVRYMCTFYKPKNIWLVNEIVWDDQIRQLFE
ncbi:hypothetical protein JYT55_00715 [Mariprofundus ferrooxydans]|nr:hypothetical protein [Mariprofundus ferrooxydans]